MIKNPNSQIAATLCLLVLLVIHMMMTAKLLIHIQKSPLVSGQHDKLPCRALPARFVIEEPDCANNLLKLMNITNVHILPVDAFDSPVNETLFQIQNQPAKEA